MRVDAFRTTEEPPRCSPPSPSSVDIPAAAAGGALIKLLHLHTADPDPDDCCRRCCLPYASYYTGVGVLSKGLFVQFCVCGNICYWFVFNAKLYFAVLI